MENFHIYNAIIENSIETDKLIRTQFESQNKVLYIIAGIGLILGIVIIVNQIKLKKQFKQLRELMEQKEDKPSDEA